MRLAIFLLSITIASTSLAQTAAQSLGQQLGRQTNIEADFVQYVLDASGSRLQETQYQGRRTDALPPRTVLRR